MRTFWLAPLVALALLIAAPGAAFAGGGGHPAAILSLDPVSPQPGDAVTASLRYNTRYGPAPQKASLSVIRPDGKFLWVELRRTAPDTLTGTFFIDRSGSWRISSAVIYSAITLDVPGDGRVVAPPPEPREDRLPFGLIVALALAPYPLTAAVWLLARCATRRSAPSALPAAARIPRASFA